jgi:hypothetical protein
MRALLIAGFLIAAPAWATASGDAKLQHFLANKVAGKPAECIRPDFSALPVIYDGAGVVYHTPRATYVARMQGACPALREDRTIITHSISGQLCRNDQVRIVEPTGTEYGFCTFGSFTPYSGK